MHGYAGRENERLFDQANALAELLHEGTEYPSGAHVLEAGCGVGAQTVVLARRSPVARFTSIDISPESLAAARRHGLANVTFRQADLYDLPFERNSFDHVFVCFVLEHLSRPLDALEQLKAVLKPGGTITVIEGDHASAFYYPQSSFARRAIDCLVDIQARMGGDALIGRRLYPLLQQAAFTGIHVSPRHVYVDASRPDMVEGITLNTFTAMVAGARDQALQLGLIDEADWNRGIADLKAAAGEGGTFNYTFFKAVAAKPI